MHPINPKPVDGTLKVILGEQQTDDYLPLPALRFPNGSVLTEWQLSDADLAALTAGGRVRFWQWTGGGKFQPIQAEVVEAADVLPIESAN